MHALFLIGRMCLSLSMDDFFTFGFSFTLAHEHSCYRFLCLRIHFIFIQWMFVCVNEKKGSKKLLYKMAKEKCIFFECLNLAWSKRKLKHIENERWTVFVICSHMVAIKSKKFFYKNFSKHGSNIPIFCHFVYNIYSSFLC